MNTKIKTLTYDVETPGPGLGQAQKCGRVKQVNGMLLDQWHIQRTNMKWSNKGWGCMWSISTNKKYSTIWQK